MSRRFVNLIVERYIGHYPASTLHRINPWRCFYPSTQQALAAAENKANFVEDARLPRAAISFYEPLRTNVGDVHFASLGSSSNSIISLYPDGNTFVFDGASRGLRVMPTTLSFDTFSFDTTSGVWSEAGDWALPFYGRVEYASELGLWFGFTSEGRQLAACDLGAASLMSPPVLKEVWDEIELPPRWVPVMSFLLPLVGGSSASAG